MEKKNETKKRAIIFGIMLFGVIVILGGVTYAFFAGLGSTNNQLITIKSGTLALTFKDSSAEATSGLNGTWTFGDSIEKELIIENTGTLDAYAKISWDNLINTYLPQSLTYTLEYKTSSTGEYQSLQTTKKNVPTSDTPSTQELANGLLIPAGEEYYYRLTITLEDLKDVNQTQDLEAKFQTKFTIEEGSNQSKNVMIARQDRNSSELIWEHKNKIKFIVFENSMIPKENVSYTYDLSQNQDNSVMGYLVPTEEDEAKYTLYIQADKRVVANSNSSNLFRGFSYLERLEGLENFDTSNVTNMSRMFASCWSLTTLNLNSFDTSNVTNMSFMFSDCEKLKILNLNNFNTSSASDISCMFNSCWSLITLNLSSFDTSNVTNMSSMFYGCSGLTTLDVSNFDTSNVTDMRQLFADCEKLKVLNLSNFNTSSVTDMSRMFHNCAILTTLDLSSFDTGNVTNMGGMFASCYDLTTLNLSNFNTGKVTDMDSMFFECKELITLNLKSFNTSNVTGMGRMFEGCENLLELDISNFDTSKVTDIHSMFECCINLTVLNLSNWNVSSVGWKSSMLLMVPSTIQITVSNNEMKQWVIEASYSPELTDDNFVIHA